MSLGCLGSSAGEDETIQITPVLRTWRETGPCHHGSGEAYVREHWFQMLTDAGETMKIHFSAVRIRNNTLVGGCSPSTRREGEPRAVRGYRRSLLPPVQPPRQFEGMSKVEVITPPPSAQALSPAPNP